MAVEYLNIYLIHIYYSLHVIYIDLHLFDIHLLNIKHLIKCEKNQGCSFSSWNVCFIEEEKHW